TSEEHLLIADRSEAFAAAVLRLLGDATLRSRMAASARALLEARFSWDRIAQQFEQICARTLERMEPKVG
ncbi:MAG: glycosyltransferase, partial [Rhodospirillales bacterium]|nr:glycosyltransferase [Rhodospirillales bacterium]